jgi:hypothetical protein
MFTKNVGNPDRVIRIMVGASLWYLAYLASGTAAWILGIAGFIAVITGLLGWCGLYTLLCINTCKLDEP